MKGKRPCRMPKAQVLVSGQNRHAHVQVPLYSLPHYQKGDFGAMVYVQGRVSWPGGVQAGFPRKIERAGREVPGKD
jgi:hypothetical protein